MAGLLGLFALMLVVAVTGFGTPLQKVNEILEARDAVVEALRVEFDGDDRVEVTESGAVRLNAQVLFDLNEYALKSDGQDLLLDVMPRYLNAVTRNAGLVESLHRVQVEGHADPTGGYLSNLDLSQRRAASVVRLLVDSLATYQEFVQEKFVASGRSESDPVYSDVMPDEVDYAASRRIQIDMVLKDDDLVSGLMQVFRSLGMRGD